MKSRTKKIGIIGGGISGLTTAFLLKRRGFEVTLLEKSARAGGNIQTVKIDDFLIEYAPNSLLKSPRLVELIRELELDAEVLAANPANKKRYVLRDGRLKALPMTIAKMIAGDYFSVKAKLRLVREPFIGSKSDETESVAGFFERRLGREIVDRAADPFIAGIYAGNPEKLSIKAAFPRLFELEKNYGSLFVGALRATAEKTEKNFPRTFSFKKGVQTLTDRLAENLGESVRTDTTVLKIERLEDEKWSVLTKRRRPDGNRRGGTKIPGRSKTDQMSAVREIFDALVVSTPAEAAANLVESTAAGLSTQLRNIYYPPVAMIFFGVKKDTVAHDLDGFGFLIPSAEQRRILGTIWNSAVFENRAPAGYDLLTTFVGGARNADIFEKSDEELFEIVFEELKSILGLRRKPVFTHIKRWQKAIPQYLLGYEKIETALEEFESQNQGIYFCSNFYKGISVGDCVRNAFETADRVEEFLKES